MKAREINKAIWKEILDKQENVSFFETPSWYSLWEKYFTTTSTTFIIDDHLLLSTIKLKGAKGMVSFKNSSPAGTYSNFRSMNGSFEMTGNDFKNIQKVTGVNFLRMSPFSNIRFSENIDFFTDDFTQYIDLKTIDKVNQDWSRNHNRLYRNSLNASLTATTSNDRNDWNSYVKLYNAFVKKKGSRASTAYKSKLFDDIFNLNVKHRDLWIVKKGNKVIAGRLVFYTKDYAVEWHASSLREANEVGANQLLIFHIIEDAKSRGIAIYDFNPSNGNDGVVAFKEKFGATLFESKIYKNYNQIQKLYLFFR